MLAKLHKCCCAEVGQPYLRVNCGSSGCMPDGKDEGALMLSSDMALASTPCISTSLWDGLGCNTGQHRVSGRLISWPGAQHLCSIDLVHVQIALRQAGCSTEGTASVLGLSGTQSKLCKTMRLRLHSTARTLPLDGMQLLL